MTKFNTSFHGAFPFSDLTAQIGLAADTALTYTVPGTSKNVYRAEFSWPYNANVWVGYNTTAVVPPAGAITVVTNNSLEMNPAIKYVRGGDVLSFKSDSLVANAGMALLELPSQ